MGAPRKTLQLAQVLAALLEDPLRPSYGLEIVRTSGLSSGTTYPILARLEQEGWVESSWEDIDPSAEGRRPRRYYRITGEGARRGTELLDEFEKVAGRVAAPAPKAVPGLSTA